MTDENSAVQDITVVVTGASSGIGLAAARELARRGAQVALVGRDPGRLAAALAQVSEAAARPPRSFQADFDRLAQVRRLADELAAAYPRIDVLANNAGGLVGDYRRTEDGFESTVQSNHLAPFLLTTLLRERLRGGRVVNTSSDAHRMGHIDPNDFTGSPQRYRSWSAYGAGKQANVLFAAEAARRWPDILSTSFAPGAVRTRFASGTWMSVFFKVAPFLATPEQGADTLVWLATAPTAELTPGGFYAKRRLRRPAAGAADPALAARLWDASVTAVGAATPA